MCNLEWTLVAEGMLGSLDGLWGMRLRCVKERFCGLSESKILNMRVEMRHVKGRTVSLLRVLYTLAIRMVST